MGFVDKLKNIFFEEEEEEEIEEVMDERPLKKEKEIIAKKVEVPKVKRETLEFSDSKEKVQEVKPKIEEYIQKKELPKRETPKINELIFDDDDFILDEKKVEVSNNQNTYKSDIKNNYFKEEVKKEPVNYDYKRETSKERETTNSATKTFTPSPIISPIYGILDKNYRKEEVKEKKEVRISSRPSKMDLDSVRNKAFGDLEVELFDNDPLKDKEKEVEISKSEIKKVREMTHDKPAIDRVTLGEADEYFNDLGLAYNTDYKDISKEINDGRVPDEKEKGDKLEDNLFDLIESMYDKED